MPVIPATSESLKEEDYWAKNDSISKINRSKGTGDVVGHLPSKHKALGSNSIPQKKKKKKTKKLKDVLQTGVQLKMDSQPRLEGQSRGR
jgi:hypothetical protein